MRELAAQAGRVLWPQWPDVQHSDWRLIHAAAVAAKVLFSDAWLLRSVEATAWQIRHGGRQVRNRASYLVGVLRSKCHVMAGVGDSPQDCSADWFASVLYPLEQCVEVFCQPVAQARQTQPPSPAQEPADWRSMSDQERADARAAIADVVKQLKPCKP